MSSKMLSVFGGVVAVALMTVVVASQGCGSSSSGSYEPTCEQACQKEMACFDASTTTTPADCMTQCMNATNMTKVTNCKNSAAIISYVQMCLGMPACTGFESCISTLPACQSTSGSGGSNGTGGSSGSGGSNGATGGAAGQGATGGAGGAAAADCSACANEPACCTAIATAESQSSAGCAGSTTAMCNASTSSASIVTACQGFTSAGKALSIAACN